MTAAETLKAHPRVRKALIAAAIVLVLFTVAGFLVLPLLARSVLERKLSETLHREVSIRGLAFNPYALSAAVDGLVVRERNAPATLLSFERLYVNLEIASLVRGGIVLREIRLSRPYVNVVRDRSGRYNFSDLVEEFSAPPKKESAPLRYSLNNIQVDNGAINFWDGPRNTGHEVREMAVRIPFFSNFPHFVESFVQPLFQARINGHSVSLAGRTKPFSGSRESVVDLDVTGLSIPYYMEYAPYTPRFKFRSGLLDLKTELSFIQRKDEPPAIRLTGDVALRAIDLRDASSRPMIDVPRLDVRGIAVDTASRTVVIGSVSAEKGALVLRRDPDGSLNAASLARASPDGPAPPAAAREDVSAGEEPPWGVTVKELALTGYAVRWEDATTPDPVVLAADKVEIAAKNLSTDKNSRGEASLALRLGRKGIVSVRGPVGVEPPTAELSVAVKGIEIKPVRPYFADKVRILVTDGSASVRGTISLSRERDRGFRASFRGEAGVAKFSSLDEENAEEFLSFESLHAGGIDLSVNPVRLRIKEIALADFTSRIVVNPDGALNVQGIVANDNEAAGVSPDRPAPRGNAAAPPARDEGLPVRIDRVTLQGGTINFSDRYVKPSYSANLLEIGGRVSGLSPEESAAADVDLRGKFENVAPLTITGKMNPLRKDLLIDLKVDFQDMDLSPLTPYSGRYAGYTIQKGKLALDLKYLIVNRTLDSQNVVRLDQFTFGDPVDSPEATKLPVRLAVALLKDRRGDIRLDLPVTGSLDDPKFSVWRVVVKIVTNLLVKAATSPFALLGAIFGGGEEMSYVEFDYGSPGIGAPAAAKLANLEKALYERPALKLDIVGHVDVEKDREALRQSTFARKVKAQKLKEIVKRGEPAVALEDIRVDPAEYPKYLERAYKEEKFPKPRNIIGIAKTLPVPEMEKLMLTNIRMTDDDLRQLALARAGAVREQLLLSKRVEPERIFLVEPKTLPPERKETIRDSRVDFVVK